MIKTKFIFLILICLFVNQSKAQFNVGFLGEVSSNKFGGVPPPDATYESVTGFGGSLIGEVKIVKDVYLSFQPGFLTKGSKIKFGNEEKLFNDTVITFEVSQSYFALPLNLKFYRGNFYVGAGCSVEFLSSANISVKDSSSETDIKDKFKQIDVVSNFNMGYKFSIGKPYLFFELRYLQGLLNINEQNNYTANDIYVASFKSQGLSLVAGLLFSIK